MSKKNKAFYVWTMAECIKDTYEFWGFDMMSMFDKIYRNFPNAAEAIKKMYGNFKAQNCYSAKSLQFENPQLVYEAISSLVPVNEKLQFHIWTKEQSKKYRALNICSCIGYESINRMDLLMAVLLFTEEFIFLPLTAKNVIMTDNKLICYGKFVTLEVTKNQDNTLISIMIRNVILLHYLIKNY